MRARERQHTSRGQAEQAQIEEGMPGGGRRVNGSAMQCHCGSDNTVGRSLGGRRGTGEVLHESSSQWKRVRLGNGGQQGWGGRRPAPLKCGEGGLCLRGGGAPPEPPAAAAASTASCCRPPQAASLRRLWAGAGLGPLGAQCATPLAAGWSWGAFSSLKPSAASCTVLMARPLQKGGGGQCNAGSVSVQATQAMQSMTRPAVAGQLHHNRCRHHA